jgi:hypothetical protein
VGSDQWPIVLDFGEDVTKNPKIFYFEEHWLLEKDFETMFSRMCQSNKNNIKEGRYSMDI